MEQNAVAGAKMQTSEKWGAGNNAHKDSRVEHSSDG